MTNLINRIIPKDLKSKIKSSQKYQGMQAKKLASTSKRVDICAAQFAHSLHLSKHPSLSGKVCLEIGAGWVLSHAIVCHLLGAKKVIVTDIFPHAYPQSLYIALHESIVSIIRDILSPFEEHSLIRSRLDYLLTIRQFDFNVLKSLGIEYIAPINIADEQLNIEVDFIYSNSVLEHVPCDDVPLLLKNMVAELKSGGSMIHRVHLEDHKNISGDPFGFLSISSDKYYRSVQSSRGNRIRKSGWQEIFKNLEEICSEFVYEWVRQDKSLPNIIDHSIKYKDEIDLKTSHIGIYSKKK